MELRKASFTLNEIQITYGEALERVKLGMATTKEFHEFVQNGPLYKEVIPSEFPEKISRSCPTCDRETTWVRSRNEALLSQSSKDYAAVIAYKCHLCTGREYIFVTKGTGWKDGEYKTLIKIGEWPANRPSLSRPLEKQLGASAELFKKALSCRNFGLGLASLAYTRRVVEDKVRDLLEIVAVAAHEEGFDATAVERIRAAKDSKEPFETKLKVASEAIPSHLRPGGANPLSLLYALVSKGIHNLEEEECLMIADEIRDVFEYVFETLQAQIEDRQRFAAKVAKWAGNKREL